MSIATICTRGFGSFGAIRFVVTRGYSINSAPPPPVITSRGVRKGRRHSINLSDLAEQTDRNRASEFLKRQLALDRASLAEASERSNRVETGNAKRSMAMSSAPVTEPSQAMKNAKALGRDNNDLMAILMISAQS